MMKKRLFVLGATACATMAAVPAEAVSYVYVGSWEVSAGAGWSTEPASHTGQTAAALLFGGQAAEYAISTLGEEASMIDFSAWYGVLGASGPHYGAYRFAQDYVAAASTQAPGSYFSGNLSFSNDGQDAASAYVSDNVFGPATNYAFRMSPPADPIAPPGVTDVAGEVPEPSIWGMLLLGFGMLGFARRRRRRNASFGFA